MIGQLRGRVQTRWEYGVVVDVGGVGYEVHMPSSALAELPPKDQELVVHTHLVWREETFALYGFHRREEREMFRVLLEVSGVGPRLALNLLSYLSVEELLKILATGEPKRLQSVHGVGKKTAARLCVDLKERAQALLRYSIGAAEGATYVSTGGDELWNDAFSALTHLGYKPAEAEGALSKAREELGEEGALEDLVRLALRLLAKGG